MDETTQYSFFLNNFKFQVNFRIELCKDSIFCSNFVTKSSRNDRRRLRVNPPVVSPLTMRCTRRGARRFWPKKRRLGALTTACRVDLHVEGFRGRSREWVRAHHSYATAILTGQPPSTRHPPLTPSRPVERCTRLGWLRPWNRFESCLDCEFTMARCIFKHNTWHRCPI
jgi:hypothetical protein